MPSGRNTFTLIDPNGAEVFLVPTVGPAALPVTIRDPTTGAQSQAVSAAGAGSVQAPPDSGLPSYCSAFNVLATAAQDRFFRFEVAGGVTANIQMLSVWVHTAVSNVFSIERLSVGTGGAVMLSNALDPGDPASSVTIARLPAVYTVSVNLMARFNVPTTGPRSAHLRWGDMGTAQMKPLRVTSAEQLGLTKAAGVAANYSIFLQWSESA